MSTFPVVIIGAGPAGIAAAIEAMNRGFKAPEIIMIEKAGEIAYMISSKYPDEKPILANYKGRMAACLGDMCITDMTKKEFFDYLNDVVKKYELHINFHQQVKNIIKLKNGQFNLLGLIPRSLLRLSLVCKIADEQIYTQITQRFGITLSLGLPS